jgi:GWxTD domain-containing protein
MRKAFPSAVFVFLALWTLSTAIEGQSPTVDPSNKPIKAKPEANNAFKKWLTEDAGPIITAAERKAYLALTTDQERENFIEKFWDRRDPDPDTQENEYREAYYERIAYANEHFSSGIPGSKSDRGRIYIRWGKPDEIESHPSGGAYDKASYEGGGSATTFPFERWFYRHLDGVGDGVEIEFVDQTGSGEYRIARDIREKFLTIGPSQSIAATDANSGFVREQDNPFAVAEKLKNLDTPPAVRYSEIDATIAGSGTIDKNPVDVDMQIGFFRQSEGRVIAAFTVEADNQDLSFDSRDGQATAHVNILGRITSVAGRRIGIFEDSVATNATTAELLAVKNHRSIYQRSVALAPGTYKIDIVVRDIATGNRGIVSRGFTVPRYDGSKLATSSVVIARAIRSTTERDLGDPFVIGNTKLVPNLTGTFKVGEPVGIYMQIYNAGTDESTLRPSVDVEYLITENGKQVSKTIEDWSGLSDASQRLTLSRRLPTESLKPGTFEVQVIVKDRVSGQRLETRSRFTIVK